MSRLDTFHVQASLIRELVNTLSRASSRFEYILTATFTENGEIWQLRRRMFGMYGDTMVMGEFSVLLVRNSSLAIQKEIAALLRTAE